LCSAFPHGEVWLISRVSKALVMCVRRQECTRPPPGWTPPHMLSICVSHCATTSGARR
jgi:hypothetical protein